MAEEPEIIVPRSQIIKLIDRAITKALTPHAESLTIDQLKDEIVGLVQKVNFGDARLRELRESIQLPPETVAVDQYRVGTHAAL